jgi:hypothetical protein
MSSYDQVAKKQSMAAHGGNHYGALFAVFPALPSDLVLFQSFTAGLQLTSFFPTEISLVNYQILFESPAIPFLTWMAKLFMDSWRSSVRIRDHWCRFCFCL